MLPVIGMNQHQIHFFCDGLGECKCAADSNNVKRAETISKNTQYHMPSASFQS